MVLLFGFRTRITKADVDDILEGACPQCGKDLELSDLKKWFTLYFIPIFPFSHIDTFYHCKACDASYKEGIKEKLMASQKDRKKVQEEAQRMFAITLAACMTHMAKIDGKMSSEEKKELKKLSQNYKKFKSEIEETVDKVTTSDDDEFVYETIRNAQSVLTKEGIIILIAQVARVLLADGKIDPAEEKLMKEYMLICGIPRNLFKDILDRVKKLDES